MHAHMHMHNRQCAMHAIGLAMRNARLYDVMDDWSRHKHEAWRRSVNVGLAQARPNYCMGWSVIW